MLCYAVKLFLVIITINKGKSIKPSIQKIDIYINIPVYLVLLNHWTWPKGMGEHGGYVATKILTL